MVLITKSTGIFESKARRQIKISEGAIVLLIPGIWHRYKPLKKVGWTERWVGFSGAIATQLLTNVFLTRIQLFFPTATHRWF